TAAIAADAPPKEGAFTGKVTVSGELLKTTPLGKNGDTLNVYEENGTSAVGEKVHCFWLVPAIKNTAMEPQGWRPGPREDNVRDTPLSRADGVRCRRGYVGHRQVRRHDI